MRKTMMKSFVVPLALAGVLLTGAALPAVAEVVTSPAQALKLLTEARVAAGKCGWLSAAERRELADYAARAELVAVRRAGAAAARSAVAAGRKMGSAGCSAERREKTLAVLHGAREAMRASGGARRVAQRQAAQRPAPRNRVRASATVSAGDASVRRYRRLAAAYYNALKCRNRPQGELMAMWRQVRDLHFSILRRGEKRALARAKEAARRAGMRRGCARG